MFHALTGCNTVPALVGQCNMGCVEFIWRAYKGTPGTGTHTYSEVPERAMHIVERFVILEPISEDKRNEDFNSMEAA